LKGVPFWLIDTAGLRETEDLIEQMGITKTEANIAQSDLILLMFDGSQPLTAEDRQIISNLKDRPVLAIINKTDLPQVVRKEDLPEFDPDRIIEISLHSKSGLKELQDRIVALVGLGDLKLDDRPLLSRIRHKQALEKAVSALAEFISGLLMGRSEDLLAVDLRTCLDALGLITGKNVSSEVIQGIFAQFCIGK